MGYQTGASDGHNFIVNSPVSHAISRATGSDDAVTFAANNIAHFPLSLESYLWRLGPGRVPDQKSQFCCVVYRGGPSFICYYDVGQSTIKIHK